MLPIAMTLIRFTSSDPNKVSNLSADLLFSIAYGCLVGSIGTPSGGGRNAIMISYFRDANLSISYIDWMIKIYPMVLIQIPIVAWILQKSFIPEYSQLDSGVRKLAIQVAKSRKMTGRNTVAALIFFLVFLGWVFFSESIGLGTIALTGVLAYMIGGFVRWEDLNRNTHWGVIILFGATVSLGVNIKATGAANWLANQVINLFGELMETFPFVSDAIVVLMTTTLANVLSSSATVAVLGPVTLNIGSDPMHSGLVTAIASAFGYFTAVAAPACTIVYSSGMVKAVDFLKVGWKVGIMSMILLVIYVNTYWLFIN
jgi:sodium-dependent dicarboxylate transporter 2/3/5